MAEQKIFKRYEIKYQLNRYQYDAFKEKILEYMDPDPHGKSTILSLYMDSPDYLLCRRSMEKPLYKEKLRLRSYGRAKEDSTVFIEIKKKFDGIVYKRREEMTANEMASYIEDGSTGKNSQIMKEIDYAVNRYDAAPKVLLMYDREAYYGKDDHEFRMTMDQNIRYRDTDLDLRSEIYGERIIPEDMIILEIKVAGGIPLWLVKTLRKLEIHRCSFSKYTNAYISIKQKEGKLKHA